ncbi:MAG: hypothetical protein U0S48_17935 [Solirubrobacteraceae bacterium]
MIATSMPKMLGGPNGVKEGTVGALARREWELWSELRKRELPRVPAFGDYAIQNPEPPADDIGGNTMRANIRYTTTSETIVARGAAGEPGGQRAVPRPVQLITAHPEFSGPGYLGRRRNRRVREGAP